MKANLRQVKVKLHYRLNYSDNLNAQLVTQKYRQFVHSNWNQTYKIKHYTVLQKL